MWLLLLRLPAALPFVFTALKVNAPLALIAGPCVIESEEHCHFLAKEIAKVAGDFVFKASFDKANRSNAGAS